MSDVKAVASSDVSTTYIDLIRHGEPDGGNVFRGRVNLPLTETGKRQFQARVKKHRHNWQHIITSPLQRCSESAHWLANDRALPCTEVTDWQEIDYGDWENKPVDEVFKQHSHQAQKMWQQPLEFCAPNGEPVPEFQQRIVAAWKQLLEEYQGQHVLLVNHGGVMRVLTQYLLKLDPQAMNRLAIPYAGLIRFKVDHTNENGKTRHWVSLLAMDGEELNDDRVHAILGDA
ncbi:histidine phosphatase family protein [Bacterioplanoides sp.]|uniref:histidine phosphatase family protein n=1 Tax=Bacterioplanoides sp. TaxID=2066072 RepID=UPI003B58CDF6